MTCCCCCVVAVAEILLISLGSQLLAILEAFFQATAIFDTTATTLGLR